MDTTRLKKQLDLLKEVFIAYCASKFENDEGVKSILMDMEYLNFKVDMGENNKERRTEYLKKQVSELEKEYFSLLKSEKYPDEIKNIPFPKLDLHAGDWIWDVHFKEANKIKSIVNGYVRFYFKFDNGLDAALLSYIENKENIGRYHRYATENEIIKRLNKEIQKLKNGN